MSDITHRGVPSGAATPVDRGTAAVRPWRLAPYACVVVAGTAGLLAGRAMGGDASAFEGKLLLLLRFMAVMKLAGVFAAAAVLHWRLNQKIAGPLVASYMASLAAMALAAGLIWSLGAIATGAILFHLGLLAFLVLAWRDDGARLPRRG